LKQIQVHYEVFTVDEMVRDVFGSIEECIDKALLEPLKPDAAVLAQPSVGGEGSATALDWLLHWQEYSSSEDAPLRRATPMGKAPSARKVR